MRVARAGAVILESMKTRVLIGLVLSAGCLAAAAPGTVATGPTLRIGAGTDLSLIGAGFKPRILVTLRIQSSEFTRRVTVRSSTRGSFVIRFPALERCAPRYVTARAANGVDARVPVVWFVRECPPPPPLQPSTPPSQSGIASA